MVNWKLGLKVVCKIYFTNEEKGLLQNNKGLETVYMY